MYNFKQDSLKPRDGTEESRDIVENFISNEIRGYLMNSMVFCSYEELQGKDNK